MIYAAEYKAKISNSTSINKAIFLSLGKDSEVQTVLGSLLISDFDKARGRIVFLLLPGFMPIVLRVEYYYNLRSGVSCVTRPSCRTKRKQEFFTYKYI